MQPRVRTRRQQRSARRPGARSSTGSIVEGLAGETVTVQAALYGPFATPRRRSCAPASPSGAAPSRPAATASTRPSRSADGARLLHLPRDDRRERARPRRRDALRRGGGDDGRRRRAAGADAGQRHADASRARGSPTASIVTGLGALDRDRQGRRSSARSRRAAAITLRGHAVLDGHVTASGDGTYTTAAGDDRPGRLLHLPRVDRGRRRSTRPSTGKCGETSETTLARAAPSVTTVVSNEVVAPGFRIYDTDPRQRSRQDAEARIGVELFGPFATRDAIRCTGEPYWHGEVFARATARSGRRSCELRRAGFYTYREHLVGSDLVAETRTACALVAETALARPLILTGRNERVVQVRAAAAPDRWPRRGCEWPPAGSTPRVSPSASTSERARSPRRRTSAARLVARRRRPRLGHGLRPDRRSRRQRQRPGPGAFFRLREARRGDRIQVTARNGRVVRLPRHVGADDVKSRLPTSIYSRAGRHRLVLVTCGGPFVEAEGHYRDNIVVTAVRG